MVSRDDLAGEQLNVVDVDAITLDSFCNERNLWPDLIKIDTEGFELNVLIGATDCIRKVKPTIIFETTKQEEKKALFSFFQSENYGIYSVGKDIPMTWNEFFDSNHRNFVASKSAFS